MTDKKIDFELALAIGYATHRVRVFKTKFGGFVQVCNNDGIRCDGPMHFGGWQRFSHKDPAVIWPIAEQFDAFPMRIGDAGWFTPIPGCNWTQNRQQCAATASALTVIAHCKKGQL